MGRKLGFITPQTSNKKHLEESEYECIRTIFDVMAECSSDFTNTFRTLALISRTTEINSESD